MIIVNAPNIHCGGGKVLLDSFIQAILKNQGTNFIFILDKRIKKEYSSLSSSHIIIKFVNATVFSRLMNEFFIYKTHKKNDVIIYFSNIPPFFKLNCQTFLFFQNRLLLVKISNLNLKILTMIRIYYEKFLLKINKKNVDQFIVQSQSMKCSLFQYLNIQNSSITVRSFFDSNYLKRKSFYKLKKSIDFIYLASGDGHKNHFNLIDAFCLLADLNFFPSLLLTIDENLYPKIINYLNNKKLTHKIKIQNIGFQNRDQVLIFLAKSKCLIYPSFYESFGLPLLEAKEIGIDVIASELDYVREIIDPIETFNPNSALSISRAIMRYMKKPYLPNKIESPDSFVKKIIL